VRRRFQIVEQVQRKRQDDGFLGLLQLCQAVRGRRGEGQLGQREAWTGIFPLGKMVENGNFLVRDAFGKK
jgi:hypothetical protein